MYCTLALIQGPALAMVGTIQGFHCITNNINASKQPFCSGLQNIIGKLQIALHTEILLASYR